jgi:hypothetical protein
VVLALLLSSACEPPSKTPPPYDGGPPLTLEVLDPPGSQIGLHYSRSVALRASYHTDDDARTPVAGTVRFSIFGDPAGSTLSADRVNTDGNGVAQVTLTAGAAEATFRVTASAANAPDAEFQVSVSKLEFVGLSVQLAWDASAPTTLRALLYINQPCAQLPPAPTSPTPLRSAAKPGPSATIPFINLLSMNYSLVGRAEDATGRLVAQGCADVPSALVPAGTSVSLPLPLSAVAVDPTGSYTLTSSLTISAAAAATATQAWHGLGDCPMGLAQALLDTTAASLTPALQVAIADVRGAPSGTSACRPGMVASSSTLDNDLESLLAASGMPGAELTGMIADLDALVGSAQLSSQLVVSDAGPDLFSGEHTLQSLVVGPAAGPRATTNLVESGLPIIDAKDVAVSYDQGKLAIGAHGFTLELPLLWQDAFESQAIGPRFPALMPPSTRGWLGLAVGALSHGGMSGCAGVEDLICGRTAAANCIGAISPACLVALDHLTGQLEAGFRTTPGIDFTLSGQCSADDTDGDLSVDQLSGGVWSTPVATSATFDGAKP